MQQRIALSRLLLVLATLLLVSGIACADQTPKHDSQIKYATEKDILYLPQKEAEVTPYQQETKTDHARHGN